jgi:hypothetical protein
MPDCFQHNSVLASRQPQHLVPRRLSFGNCSPLFARRFQRQTESFGNNPASSASLFGRLLPTTPSNPAPNVGTVLGDISVPFSIFPRNLLAGKPAAVSTAHRNALIHLLHMSKKICFSVLFNAVIRPNILGRSRFSMPFPVEHAKLIYMRTSNSSTLRRMAMDHISRTSGLDRLTYMQMAQENGEFLAGISGMVPFGGIGGFGEKC